MEEKINDFPVVCETCLGENPYMRMTKQQFGKECKICARPYTVYRWSPGHNMRYKHTAMCNTCCKLKNLCSACALDLDLKISVSVRDTALGIKDPIAKQNINREFYINNAEQSMAQNDGKTNLAMYGKLGAPSREVLKRITQTDPYKKRNRTQVCPEWLAGECDKGSLCPYRHEKDAPVAPEYTDKSGNMDPNSRTLFITGISEAISDDDVRDYFSAFGEVTSATAHGKKKCAFVTFAERSSAESAQMSTRAGLMIKDHLLICHFAKQRAQGPTSVPLTRIAGEPSRRFVAKAGVVPPPPGTVEMLYPSQSKFNA